MSWASIAAKQPKVKKPETPPPESIVAEQPKPNGVKTVESAEPPKPKPKPVDPHTQFEAVLPTSAPAQVAPRGVWGKKAPVAEEPKPTPIKPVTPEPIVAARAAEPVDSSLEVLEKPSEETKVEKKKGGKKAKKDEPAHQEVAPVASPSSLVTEDGSTSLAAASPAEEITSPEEAVVEPSAETLPPAEEEVQPTDVQFEPQADERLDRAATPQAPVQPPVTQSAIDDHPVFVAPPEVAKWSAEPSPFEYGMTFVPAEPAEPQAPPLDQRVLVTDSLALAFSQRKLDFKFRAPQVDPLEQRAKDLDAREVALGRKANDLQRREEHLERQSGDLARQHSEIAQQRRQLDERAKAVEAESLSLRDVRKQNEAMAKNLESRNAQLEARAREVESRERALTSTQQAPPPQSQSSLSGWYGPSHSERQQQGMHHHMAPHSAPPRPPQSHMPHHHSHQQHQYPQGYDYDYSAGDFRDSSYGYPAQGAGGYANYPQQPHAYSGPGGQPARSTRAPPRAPPSRPPAQWSDQAAYTTYPASQRGPYGENVW